MTLGRPTVQIAVLLVMIGLSMTIIAVGLGGPVVTYLGLLLQCIGLVYLARQQIGSYSSLSMLFVMFYCLYTLSGPWQVVIGAGLSDLFGEYYQAEKIGLLQGLAGIGLGAGFLISRPHHVGNPSRPSRMALLLPNLGNKASWQTIAILTAMLGSFMEFINFVRVGGLAAFTLGKAHYQSQISELTGTLPGFNFTMVASAFLGMVVARTMRDSGSRRQLWIHAILFLIAVSFSLFIAVGIGRRGVFVACLLAGFLGYGIETPVRRLRASLVLAAILVYVAMGFLYANRAILSYTIITGDSQYLEANLHDSDRLLRSLNPGMMEFGAPYGNLSTYLNQPGGDRLWGQSYFTGLLVIVPGFLYPGDKPTQVTYEYRDRYFPELGLSGRIAGSGFSAILEAYMNFGIVGVMAVYAACGALLSAVDRRHQTFGAFGKIVYCLAAPLTQLWHRSAFGDVIGTFFVNTVVAAAIVIALEYGFQLWRIVVSQVRGGHADG